MDTTALVAAISRASVAAGWSADQSSTARPHLCVNNDYGWSATMGTEPPVARPSDWIRVPLFVRAGERDADVTLRRRAVVDAICRAVDVGLLPWRGPRDEWRELLELSTWDQPTALAVDCDAPTAEQPAPPPLPRFVLDVCFPDFGADIVEQCGLFLTGQPSSSQAFVPPEILAVAPSGPSKRIEVALDLRAVNGADGSKPCSLGPLRELFERLERQSDGEPGQLQFVITSLLLGDFDLGPHELPLLLDLVTRHSPSIAIRYLYLGEALTKCVDNVTFTAVQQFFSALLLDDRPNPLEALAIDDKRLSVDSMLSLSSILRYNRHLRSLRFGSLPARWSEDKRDIAWAWFEFGVLSATSRSQLRELQLKWFPFGDVSEYLASLRPTRWLLETEFPAVEKMIAKDASALFAPPGKEWVVQVKDRAKARLLPKANAPALEVSLESATSLEVIVTLSKWTCVIVPAFGFGWLKNTDIVTRDRLDSSWNAFTNALLANETVEFVRVGCASDSAIGLMQALLLKQWQRVIRRPLGRRARLAFLSVVRQRQETRDSGHLDAAIVSNVFAFAATSVTPPLVAAQCDLAGVCVGGMEHRQTKQHIWEKLVGPPSPASLGPDWDAVSCYHPTPPLPRFVIDFCNNEMTSEAVDQAVQFLTGASSDSQSFVPAEILKLAPDAPSTRVEVSLSLGSWGSPTAQFDTMLEMIQRFEDYDEESVGQVQFVITSLILGGVEVRSHQITRLQELVTRNSQRVSIRHLNLGDVLVKWADDSTLTAIQQFFAALLRDDRVNPLTALVFDGKLLSLECMIALASALRYNWHLCFLSLGSKPLRRSDDKFDLAWAWLVFGVLDVTSSSALRELVFSALPVGDLSEYLASDEHVRWLLETEFPVVKKLIAKDASASFAQPGREWVTKVKDRAKARQLPKANAQALGVSFSGDLSYSFEVVMTLSAWTCVIVPGFGFGWLKNADVLGRLERDPVPRRESPVRSFSPWTFTNDKEAENAIRLIRDTALGAGLRLLSCNWFSSTVKNITRTLLSSCPALQQVRLSAATAVSPDDHDTLALLHRLDVLYLESAPFSWPLFAPDRARPLQLLTKLLSVPSCQLRYVSVPHDGPSADDWTAFSDALAANTSVEFVQIVNVSGPSVARLQSLMERERRRIVHRPATKLAFLSVVRHRQAMRPRSGHLDAGIVSNIFALAATERGF
ncbi:hypothetical protein ATCC90586_001674 [Pythium insidiosum]|nr:hypothetical protein ATCC90586_001674 [Pythium insidiosum]